MRALSQLTKNGLDCGTRAQTPERSDTEPIEPVSSFASLGRATRPKLIKRLGLYVLVHVFVILGPRVLKPIQEAVPAI